MSPRKSVGFYLFISFQLYRFESALHAPLIVFFTLKEKRHAHIIFYRIFIEQIVFLKNKADFSVTVIVVIFLRKTFKRPTVYRYVAAVEVVKSAQNVQKRGLAATRLAEYKHQSRRGHSKDTPLSASTGGIFFERYVFVVLIKFISILPYQSSGIK